MARNRIYGVSPETPHLSELEITTIRPNPYQPRVFIPADYLEELTASIKEHGQIDPIDVLVNKEEPGTYILIDGQCRLKALEALGHDHVLAVIRQEGDPHQLALIFNIQRRGIHPLDQAASMAALIERYQYKQEDLARIVSQPRATVAETLSLNNLPDAMKEQCRTLDIGKSHLVELVKLLDQPDEMQTLFDRIRAGERITTRELQNRRRGRQAPARPADVPKALMPVIRVIETTHRVRDALEKIRPSTILTSHPERLEELKELHKEIGTLINKLMRGGSSKSRRRAQEEVPEEDDEDQLANTST